MVKRLQFQSLFFLINWFPSFSDASNGTSPQKKRKPGRNHRPRHWAINNAWDETESQAIRQRWDTKLVRGDGCRIGILPGCCFQRHKTAFSKQQKDLSQLASPPRFFVAWRTSCWFLLLNPAFSGRLGHVWLRSFYETTDHQLDCWKCTLFFLHSWNGNW